MSAVSTPVSPSALDHFFDVQKTLRWVFAHRFLRVALQLPDGLLRAAPALAARLQTLASEHAKVGTPAPFFFVLGDTSWGACCVDEIAAAHASADCLVHYGHSCGSRAVGLPVLYIFGTARLDMATAGSSLASELLAARENGGRVLLLWQPALSHLLPAVLAAAGVLGIPPNDDVAGGEGEEDWEAPHYVPVKNCAPEIILPYWFVATQPPRCSEPGIAAGASKAACACSSAGLACTTCAGGSCRCSHRAPEPAVAHAAVADALDDSFCGLHWQRLSVSDNGGGGSPSTALRVVHLGTRPARMRTAMLAFARAASLVFVAGDESDDALGEAQSAALAAESASPSALASTSSTLPLKAPTDVPAQIRRLIAASYARVEAVRASSIVGIVAGTLAVSGHKAVIAALRRAVARAGKHSYVLAVGKLSPAKLGNFPEIDVFILVACPESSTLPAEARSAHARPVATPQEALIALAMEARERGDDGVAGTADAKADAAVWTGAAEFDFERLLAATSTAASSPPPPPLASAPVGSDPGTGSFQEDGIERPGDDAAVGSDGEAGGAPVPPTATAPRTLAELLLGGEVAGPGTELTAIVGHAGSSALSTGLYTSPATLYAREKRLWRGLEYETAPADGGRAAGGVTAAAATDASAVDDQSTSTQLALRPDGPVYDTRIHEGMAGRSVRYEVDGREM